MSRIFSKIRVYEYLGSIYLTEKSCSRKQAADFIEDFQEREIDRDDVRLLSLTEKIETGWGLPKVPITKLIEEAEIDLADLPMNLV